MQVLDNAVRLSIAMLLAGILLGGGTVISVNALTVTSVEEVGLIPKHPFELIEDWELSNYEVSTYLPASYSTVILADDTLVMNHTRPQKTSQQYIWASFSETDSNSSIGPPDGNFTWSSGPEITLSDFDTSTFAGQTLDSVNLILSFAIPDELSQDQVRILVDYPGRQGNSLLTTFFHGSTPLNRFSSPYWSTSINDLTDWDWSKLADIEVTIDYNSEGTSDDTQVQVDAVGIQVETLQSWYGFEVLRGDFTWDMPQPPIVEPSFGSGSLSGLKHTPCGLETSTEGVVGHWLMDPIEKAYGQNWGRFWTQGEHNGTYEIRGSEDGETWAEDWTLISDGGQLPDFGWVQPRIWVHDGCLERVRVDFNDPMLRIQGLIEGSFDSLEPDYSGLKIAYEDNLIASLDITQTGPFELTIPFSEYLPSEPSELQLGFAGWLKWSSNGTQESGSVTITSMTLEGGFDIEYDYDPSCMAPETQTFSEDEGGRLVEFRYTCQDDITDKSELAISVDSEDSNLLSASISGDDILLQPLPEVFGSTKVNLVVTDEVGNLWSGSFNVVITEVDDPPTIAGLPSEVHLESGTVSEISVIVEDSDTLTESLVFGTDTSWAEFNGATLTLTPTEPGSTEVILTVSDGTTEVTDTLLVVVTALPDLWVEDIEVVQEQLVVGEVAEITAWIRNSGRSEALFPSIRCEVDGRLVGVSNITLISPGSLESVMFTWTVFSTSGDSSVITIIVDHGEGGNIIELNELNNIGEKAVTTKSSENDQGSGVSSWEPNRGQVWGFGTVIVVALLAYIIFQPGKIRRRID